VIFATKTNDSLISAFISC